MATARSGEPVSAAAERMTRFGFSALPVVTASGRLVGIVSLLDVLCLRQEAADRGAPADDRAAVDTIMTREVFTMAATANVAVVADRLHRRGDLRVLPITDGGRLVGVVTRGDLVRRLLPGAPTRRRRFGLRRSTDDAVDALGLLAAARRPRPPAVPEAPVRIVMTTDVVTAGPDTAVDDAAVLMLRERHSGLPVVDAAGRLLGVVSEADLLTGGNARTVGRVMTAPALSVAVDATVAQATALLVARGLRTLPVVDGDRLVGVVGRSDLV